VSLKRSFDSLKDETEREEEIDPGKKTENDPVRESVTQESL
jgi:hypothetical protein